LWDIAAGESRTTDAGTDIVAMLEQWELANFKPENSWSGNTQSERAIP
jgi:hypothetical protein